MGVTGLWPVLSELCEKQPLSFLSGKKVAVDLSGWVVEAYQAKGLNTSKNPHLRNVFFRASSLLKLGVHPIFIMEGQPPSIKGDAFKERNFASETESKSSTDISRNNFDRTLKQCQDLLNCLGVPCIKSSGEAEAFCAFLNLNGVVDGVITEDNDAFLYGANVVYRDFSSDRNDSHVHVYSLKSKGNTSQLDRNKLIAFALLLGCDYSKGVPGVGKETALKLFSELDNADVLQRFKDWKKLSESELFPGLDSSIKKETHCTRCGHIGSCQKHKKEGCLSCDSQFTCYLSSSSKPCRCSWHVNEELMKKQKAELKIYNAVKNCPDFPNMEVINEYLNYTDNTPCNEALEWKCPHVLNFQEKALNYFGWTYENSFEKILPLITAWQLFKLTDKCVNEVNFIYEPMKVVKERKRLGVNYLEVQWKLLGYDFVANQADNLITIEDKDRFSLCYNKVVEEFYRQKAELKEEKQRKNKGKKLKAEEGNRKVKSQSELKPFESSDLNEVLPVKSNNLNGDLFVESDNLNEILSPKSSPLSASFEDFTDVPLWKRVKIISKVLVDHKISSVIKMDNDNTNKIVDILLKDDKTVSNAVSCVSLNNVNAGLNSKNKENVENLSFRCNYANLNSNCECIITDEVSTDINDKKNILSGIYSDSEDSFDFLLQSSKNFIYIDNLLQKHSLEKDLRNVFSPGSSVMSPSGHELFNEKFKCGQNFDSPLSKTSEFSPCLIFSVKRPEYKSQGTVCLNSPVSKIINKSTPLLKEKISLEKNFLKTPLSSKLLRKTIFTPLIFDSSTDDSFSQTLSKMSKASPYLLYSTQKSSCNLENNSKGSPLVSETVVVNTCETKKHFPLDDNYVSTPKLSKVATKVVFSPLFFDSSSDDISLS